MKKVGMKEALLLGILGAGIIAAYSLSAGFARLIIDQTMPPMGIFYCLYAFGIASICRRYTNVKTGKGRYGTLLLLGLTIIMGALTLKFWLESYNAIAITIVAIATIALAVETMKFDSENAPIWLLMYSGLLDTTLAIVMSLCLLALTALSARESETVWLCYGYLVMTEVLIFFFFDIIIALKQAAADKA